MSPALKLHCLASTSAGRIYGNSLTRLYGAAVAPCKLQRGLQHWRISCLLVLAKKKANALEEFIPASLEEINICDKFQFELISLEEENALKSDTEYIATPSSFFHTGNYHHEFTGWHNLN